MRRLLSIDDAGPALVIPILALSKILSWSSGGALWLICCGLVGKPCGDHAD
jgi:hypothetical protein